MIDFLNNLQAILGSIYKIQLIGMIPSGHYLRVLGTRERRGTK